MTTQGEDVHSVEAAEMDDPWIKIGSDVPKDTRILLGWCNGLQGDEVPTGEFVAIGTFYSDSGKLWLMNAFDNEKVYPTHWMPLPAAPTNNQPLDPAPITSA
jgi:hypothetical protein